MLLIGLAEKSRLNFAEKVASLNRELINFTESLSEIFRVYLGLEHKRISRLQRLLEVVTELASDLFKNLKRSVSDSLGEAISKTFAEKTICKKAMSA